MKHLIKTVRTYVLIGGILVTPVAVTLWIILLLVNILTSSKFIRWIGSPIFTYLPGENLTLIEALISLLLVLTLLFITGLIFRNFIGRNAYTLMDKIMEKTPVINKVYLFVRNVSESILSQKETMFREVVMIEYPHPGSYSIAFVSAGVPPDLQQKSEQPDEPHLFVFLPTTPNPTSGFLLLVPKSKVRALNMSTSDAMRLIVSAGASAPSDPGCPVKIPSLLEKLDLMVKNQQRAIKPSSERHPNLNFPETEDSS
jgi:uncharacterized membrane protein